MIYLISQIAFIFLTHIYYNMNFIISSSICRKISVAAWDQSLATAPAGLFLWYKKNVYFWICLQKWSQRIRDFVKCKETFEKFLAACNSSKNICLQKFFFKGFWQLYFKNINFPTKTKRCLYAEFYEFKTN